MGIANGMILNFGRTARMQADLILERSKGCAPMVELEEGGAAGVELLPDVKADNTQNPADRTVRI